MPEIDPGPEPPRETEETFVGGSVTYKAKAPYEIEQAKRVARADAYADALGLCQKQQARFVKFEVHYEPACRPSKYIEGQFFCDYGPAPVVCSRKKKNPKHDAWKEQKRQNKENAAKLRKEKRAYRQCTERAKQQISRCRSRCDAERETKAGDGSGAGDGTGGSTRPGHAGRQPGSRDARVLSESVRLANKYRSDRAQTEREIQRTHAELMQLLDSPQIKESTKAWGIAGGLGFPLLWYGVGALGSSDGPFGITEVVPPLVLVGATGTAALTSVLINDKSRRERNRETREWIETARKRCDRGSLASCQQALRLSKQLHAINSRPGDRADSSLLWGSGDGWGPARGFAFNVGYMSDGVSSPPNEGGMSGFAMETVLRKYIGRLSISYAQRYGDISTEDDEIYGISSYGVGAGVQWGQGLLSPYAELRARIHHHTNNKGPSLSDARSDRVLVLGNTFNLNGVFSSRGPLVSSFSVDASLIVPVEDGFDPGFMVGLGYTMASQYDWHFDEENDPDDEPVMPSSYYDSAFVYILPSGGVGVQMLLRHGLRYSPYKDKDEDAWKEGNDHIVLGLLDLWAGRHADGWRFGMSIPSIGYRHAFDQGRWELGARVALGMGVRLDGSEVDAMGVEHDYAVMNFLPTRLYGRYVVKRVPFELGVASSLFWIATDEWEDASGSPQSELDVLSGLPPTFLYVGTGFP